MKIGDKAFLKLQAKWEKKLEKSGLTNIEQADGNLKDWHSFMFGRASNNAVHGFPAREQYYQMAGQFLYEFPFEDKTERRIWELHSEGVSILAIAKKITKEIGYTYKRKVHETLQRLTKEMLTQCRNPKE